MTDKKVRCADCRLSFVIEPALHGAEYLVCSDCGQPFWCALNNNRVRCGITPGKERRELLAAEVAA